MQVVLLERVEKLGQMGDVVTVKDGFARNFLLPKKKALRATSQNLESFKERRAQLEASNLERRTDAEAVAVKMEGARVVLLRQAGESDHLYGSVSPRDIADALQEAGYTVERSQVDLDRPIKTTGRHEIRVFLHPEVAVTVAVVVARSEADAENMERKLEAVSAEEVFENEELAQHATEELSEEEPAEEE
ncbi:50S ribosomal protein L9 [Emcibacter sp. SYSU 3D8]|uniref:50S ribosomal protein L9 n=1 Tax=Emcibacter sp. SYSU 3D8 TaxID=3133969 RepID=UPI0031FF3097